MGQRHLRIGVLALIVAATAACGTGAPGLAASPTAGRTEPPAATSFAEYAVGFCAAFDAMFRAVGNPDTGEGSTLSKALDAAVAARDGSTADGLAAQITTELEEGRRQVAYGRGWAPAEAIMSQLDRVFVAFGAMTAAKAATARGEASAVDPQVAFEAGGGVEAWSAMLAAWPGLAAERPAGVQPCANVPIGP